MTGAYDGKSSGSEPASDIGRSESGAPALLRAPPFAGDELGKASGDELPAFKANGQTSGSDQKRATYAQRVVSFFWECSSPPPFLP